MENFLVKVTFNTKNGGGNCTDEIEKQANEIIKRHTPEGMIVDNNTIQKLIKHTKESWSVQFMLIGI